MTDTELRLPATNARPSKQLIKFGMLGWKFGPTGFLFYAAH